MYAFSGWLVPLPGMETATLMCLDDALPTELLGHRLYCIESLLQDGYTDLHFTSKQTNKPDLREVK